MTNSEMTEVKVQLAVLENEVEGLKSEVDGLKKALEKNTAALIENTRARNLAEGGISAANRLILLTGVIISAIIGILGYIRQ